MKCSQTNSTRFFIFCFRVAPSSSIFHLFSLAKVPLKGQAFSRAHVLSTSGIEPFLAMKLERASQHYHTKGTVLAKLDNINL